MKFASSRRRFLLAGATAGGLLLGYGLFKPRDLLGTGNVFPVSGDEVALNAWLKIDNDYRLGERTRRTGTDCFGLRQHRDAG